MSQEPWVTGPIAPAPPPINVLALAQNGAAFVQWTALQISSATSYIVTSSAGGSVTVPAGNSVNCSATVKGLKNGTAVTFTVKAVNSCGVGVASAVSNSVTPTSLPATTLPVIRSLQFWWSASHTVSPPSNGSPLTSLVDLSGNNYNAAGSGAGSGGTWTSSWSGGKPAVTFDGNAQRYDTLASTFYPGARGAAETWVILASISANPNTLAATQGRFLSQERPSTTIGLIGGGFAIGAGATAGSTQPSILNNSFAASATITAGNLVAYNTPTLLIATRPGIFRQDGATIAVSPIVEPVVSWGANAPLAIGAMYANGFNRSIQGSIAEILIYADVLTTAEIALLETYAATLH